MIDEPTMALLTALPNFAGFTLLGLLLYRALMKSIENNRNLADKIIECYRDSNKTKE